MEGIKFLSNQVRPFLKLLKKFDYTLSGFAPTWKIIFVCQKQWEILHISKYQKTYYISQTIGELGQLEVNPHSIKFKEDNSFSHTPNDRMDEEDIETWTKIYFLVQ